MGCGGKTAAGGSEDSSGGPSSGEGSDEPDGADSITDEERYRRIWAFGTAPAPYGLGLTEDALWGLGAHEYRALRKRYDDHQHANLVALATIRADLHNVSGKYEQVYKSADFMPGAKQVSREQRIKELIAQGVAPAAACAIASSTQSREQRLHLIRTELDAAHKLKVAEKKDAPANAPPGRRQWTRPKPKKMG